jgi:hypothetical protein
VVIPLIRAEGYTVSVFSLPVGVPGKLGVANRVKDSVHHITTEYYSVVTELTVPVERTISFEPQPK